MSWSGAQGQIEVSAEGGGKGIYRTGFAPPPPKWYYIMKINQQQRKTRFAIPFSLLLLPHGRTQLLRRYGLKIRVWEPHDVLVLPRESSRPEGELSRLFKERRAPRNCRRGDRDCVPLDQVVNLIYCDPGRHGDTATWTPLQSMATWTAAKKIGRWFMPEDLVGAQVVRKPKRSVGTTSNVGGAAGTSNGECDPADSTHRPSSGSLLGTPKVMTNDTDPNEPNNVKNSNVPKDKVKDVESDSEDEETDLMGGEKGKGFFLYVGT